MGEAKRRKASIEANPCICGSDQSAARCCFTTGRWHRAPAKIDLLSTGLVGHNDECYLGHLGVCSPKLSREHLVSDAVLKVIQKERLTVEGFPWLPPGETHPIGAGSLVAKCLCKPHNSALSALDTTAGKFFAAIEACDLARDGRKEHHLFSGHDIERWFLKTLLAMGASKNFARNGKRLPAIFHSRIDAAALLQDPQGWPIGAGMYFSQVVGDDLLRGDHFWMAPLTLPHTDEICGMKASVQGLSFTFCAVVPDNTENIPLMTMGYRPDRIVFRVGAVDNIVELSWDDGQPHGPIELTFASTAGELAATGRPMPRNAV